MIRSVITIVKLAAFFVSNNSMRLDAVKNIESEWVEL